jgi:nucleoside-diphosphate-sugar epimerase
MTVFVAGAAGAIGKRLVPQLVESGHRVVAMTRSWENASSLRTLGAEPVIVDAFDRIAVIEAVKHAEPEVLIHQLTALTGVNDFKHFDREFATTNRLRTEGTRNLMEAAVEAGTTRVIAQSYGSWNYERTGAAPKSETDRFDPAPPKNQRETLEAIRQLEIAVLSSSLEGIVLRYGNLYGPGTGFADDGDIAAMVRKRAFPIVGNGAGVWSFIHVDDAASATVAAITHGAPGVYNVVDDEPATVAVWLPELAHMLGAKRPFRVPAWVGRLATGEVGVSMMTRIKGASNAKARNELDWTPRYGSWRQGFATGLTPEPATTAGVAREAARIAGLLR